MTNQPWLGNIYYLAVYNRALNKTEIKHNFQLGEDGITDLGNRSIDLPKNYYLSQNYPNPFNPSTTISFGLREDSFVNLTIFNLLGQKVKKIVNTHLRSGYHSINIDASDLSSGLYVYTINARGKYGISYKESKKMLLLK